MPSTLNPRSGYMAAPTSLRVAYLSMLVQALALFVFAISGGRAFSASAGSWWQILLGVLGSYLIFDSGNVVLKGRSLGRWLALISSGLMLAGFGWHLFAHGSTASTFALFLHGVVLANAILTIVAVLLPSSNAVFSKSSNDQSIAGIRKKFEQEAEQDAKKVVPQDYKKSDSAINAANQEKAKEAAVAAVVAKFGPGMADKAAEIADRVLSDPNSDLAKKMNDMAASNDQIDELSLNRAQRRALEKAQRTGKKPVVTQRSDR
jgi:hypothetical protein